MGEVCAIPAPAVRLRRLSRIEAAAWAIASHKWACVLAFAVIPVALRLALLPWVPQPEPAIHDEFSNLLAGDTFASGRLTNPPHLYWVFFESFHIIQQPTYMSKYPPLTGLILALGERVFGGPWAGVLLSVGLLCGLLAWAMHNWLPPFWALAGTVLAVIKIGILSYWSESYWGGTGAAIGGTLLIGSLPAIVRHPALRNGLVFATGVALLANSRPSEGLLLTIMCLGHAGRTILRGAGAPERFPVLIRALAVPLLIVMIPVGAWMAYYNLRVTGNAFLMPYMLHERQYASASAFPWVKSATLIYHHDIMREFWVGWDASRKAFQRGHFLLTRVPPFASLEKFFLGLPLFFVIAARTVPIMRSRRTKAAFGLLTIFLAALGLELEFLPHYAAPATVLFYIVAAGAIRSLWHWKPGGAWLSPLKWALLAGIAFSLLFTAFQPEHRFLYDKRDFQAQRARVLSFLERAPGKQLVFVRYGEKHEIHHEWVYNRADIDGSAIIWARSMGPQEDAKLMAYYADRHVWLLEENGAEKISPFGNGAAAVGSRSEHE